MRAPIVTLTTDFGLSDHYVGVMKGVILGICPHAQLVDISHEVSRYAIAEGAFLIGQAYRFFPPGTVHLVVVDPGVGSPRRPIVVEAAGQCFVGPDNGVFGMIFAREEHAARLIQNRQYFRELVSHTFHGRDIFAPVAAHLAAGVAPSGMGEILANYVRLFFERPRQTGERTWTGEILKVDHFGNVITNFHADDFPVIEELTVGHAKARRLVRSYAEAGPEELVAIAGSSGYLEVSMNQGSAAEAIGCRTGSACQIRV
jgi:S-adenosyl-L-methionine hydrolase (adenosine-forming)